MWRIMLAALVVMMVTSVASAAQIFHRTANDGNTFIFIIGKMEIGDDVKFKEEIVSLANAGVPAGGVAIYSPGGAVYTALRIGRYIRTMYLGVWVPTEYEPFRFNVNREYWNDFLQSRFCMVVEKDGSYGQVKYNKATHVGNPNCICASACFLVWAAGTGTHQQGLPENQVAGSPVSKLSILVHRLYFDPKEYALWSGDNAKSRYEAAEREERQYLGEMGVPDVIVQKVFSVASTEVVPLSRSEVETMDRRSLLPPYLDEMRIAKCKGERACETQFYKEVVMDRIKKIEEMK